MHPSAWPNQVHSNCHNVGDGNGEFSFFYLSLLFCSNFDFLKFSLTGRHRDLERQKELHFQALTMEVPLFASSYSSSSLYSCALTAWVLSSSSSSSLLFHRSSFCKTYYSAKFKSPRNLSIRTSGNSWVCGVHNEQKRKSRVLGLFVVLI